MLCHGFRFTHENAVGELHHVALADHGDLFAAAARVFKGGLRDAPRRLRGDFAHRQCHIRRRHEFAAAHEHIAIGVKAFGIFTREHHVESGARVAHALTRARRAHV